MSDTYALLANRYRLESRIAAGGVGEVWRATDVVLGRRVAVKLLRAEYAQHPETLARFRSEARHAGSLSHPGIAQVYDYDESAAPYPPFLVMELVDGPSLADVLADGPLEPARMLDIVAQAAAGLQAAHRSGLVHRDIKPANLLLDRAGRVKITDFGIAHAAGSAPVTKVGLLIGTPAYLAPERVAGHPATPASDLYSLGIVAHECLTGVRPYAGTPMETALAHGSRALPALPATVPAPVAAFVADLAAKDPAARPASAAQAGARAATLRDGLTADPRLPYPPVPGATQATMIDHSVTLADAHPLARIDPGADWPGQAPYRTGRGWTGRRVTLAIVAASIAAGLAGWVLNGVTAGPTPPRTPAATQPAASGGSSTPPGTIAISSASLIGQPVHQVVQQLRGMGLNPQVTWVQASDGSQQPGTVQSVQPNGPVAPGSTITVVAVRHDHGGGDGGQGGGGG